MRADRLRCSGAAARATPLPRRQPTMPTVASQRTNRQPQPRCTSSLPATDSSSGPLPDPPAQTHSLPATSHQARARSAKRPRAYMHTSTHTPTSGRPFQLTNVHTNKPHCQRLLLPPASQRFAHWPSCCAPFPRPTPLTAARQRRRHLCAPSAAQRVAAAFRSTNVYLPTFIPISSYALHSCV